MGKSRKKKKSSDIIITEHARQRAKERLSFSPKVLRKMALRAFYQGLSHIETKGLLYKFLDKVWTMEHTANNVRIYGEVLYLFADNTLVTLYQVPCMLKKLLRVSKEHRFIKAEMG